MRARSPASNPPSPPLPTSPLGGDTRTATLNASDDLLDKLRVADNLLRLRPLGSEQQPAASDGGECLTGARLFIAISSYCTRAITSMKRVRRSRNNSQRYEYTYDNSCKNEKALMRQLHNLDAIRGRGTLASMRVRLDVTENLSASPPAALDLHVERHSPSIKYGLSGVHRRHFAQALREPLPPTHFLYMEDDIDVHWQQLEALCRQTHFLDRRGTRTLMPGLLRYEVAPVGGGERSFLNDVSLAFEPYHLYGVLTVITPEESRRFAIPFNQYQACYFLPAERLRRAIAMYEHFQPMADLRDARWEHDGQTPDAVDETNSGLWLTSAIHRPDPMHSSPAHTGWFTKVVPIDGYEDHLVHHLGDRYVGLLNNGTALIEKEARYKNGTALLNETAALLTTLGKDPSKAVFQPMGPRALEGLRGTAGGQMLPSVDAFFEAARSCENMTVGRRGASRRVGRDGFCSCCFNVKLGEWAWLPLNSTPLNPTVNSVNSLS